MGDRETHTGGGGGVADMEILAAIGHELPSRFWDQQ